MTPPKKITPKAPGKPAGRKSSSTPDITRYSWQKRRDYLMMIALVAASDHQLQPEEMNMLARLMKDFRLSPRVRNMVLQAAQTPHADIEPLERKLAGSDLAYSLLLDMMSMAMADGVLMDEERFLMHEVASSLEIGLVERTILMDFIHAACQASGQSNPEPLYEHSIETAFELMKKKDIALFPHTLLCPASESYDKMLKDRWFSQRAS
ncbi:MAG: TerB family tellurite resistance protein [Deltaproteobacteria bacterium]|nr:TerB family tellurite resistance protein [Deltaproteobacteria bacterium]